MKSRAKSRSHSRCSSVNSRGGHVLSPSVRLDDLFKTPTPSGVAWNDVGLIDIVGIDGIIAEADCIVFFEPILDPR